LRKSTVTSLTVLIAATLGAVLLLVSVLADVIGIGTQGFGRSQVIGTAVGLITVVSGYWLHRVLRNDLAQQGIPRLVFAVAIFLGLPVLLIYGALFEFHDYWVDSSIAWQTVSAESQGMDSSKLDTLRDTLAGRDTWSLLIVRHGRIVYEWYREAGGAEKKHYTASLQKSLAGGMALLVALSDGRIDLDEPASRYIPVWRDDPLRSQVTIRHLATHTSGIEDAVEPGVPRAQLRGWKAAFWSRDVNPFSIVIEHAQAHFMPGTQFEYSSTSFAALGYAITASLRGAAEEDIRKLLRKRIMEPIGVPSGAWSMGYEAEYHLGKLKLHPIWGGGNYTARAVARVGQLMLNSGAWNGEQLVDPKLTQAVTTYAGTSLPGRSRDPYEPATTVGWYTNFDAVWPTVPRDAFVGAGAGHQVLLVVPSLDLVVVRFGKFLSDEENSEFFWAPLQRYLFKPLMEALIEPRTQAAP
jgi:CubicO group peptidase (beta-lactamase class C family)